MSQKAMIVIFSTRTYIYYKKRFHISAIVVIFYHEKGFYKGHDYILAFFVINIDLLQNSVVTFLRQDDSGMRLRYTLVNIREDINRKRTCDLNTRESVEILFSAVLLPLHLLRSSP